MTFNLRDWDRGTSNHRIKLLRSFLSEYENLPLPKFQQMMHPNITLLFTRLSAFFRLTYMHEKNHIDLQLQVLQLFLRDETCLSQFLSVGGASVFLDVLSMKPRSSGHKIGQRIILEILARVANSGNRTHIEMICANDGLHMLATSMRTMMDEENEHLCRSLYLSLVKSNPGVIEDVIDSLTHLLSLCEDSQPILFVCFILKRLAKTSSLSCLASIQSVNSIFPHLFNNDLRVQLEIQDLLMIAMQSFPLDSPDANDCFQFVAQKIIAVLTRSSSMIKPFIDKIDSTQSLAPTPEWASRSPYQEHYDKDKVTEMTRFVARLFQNMNLRKICEFLVDSHLHLLVFDMVLVTHETDYQDAEVKNQLVMSMMQEVANVLREIIKYEEKQIDRSATETIKRVIGEELDRKLRHTRPNEDDLSVLLQLYDTILAAESVIVEIFEILENTPR